MPLPPTLPTRHPRWTWQSRFAGVPAETQARGWLATQLDIEPSSLPLVRDTRQRPQLAAPFAQHDCNWSHSGDGLLIALGERMQVGIDLERPHPRPRAMALAQRFFTADEAQWVSRQSGSDACERAFRRLWCAKEAVLKAHGHGLSFGLDRLRFGAGADGRLRLLDCDPALGRVDEWCLQELAPAPGYVGALAWRLGSNLHTSPP